MAIFSDSNRVSIRVIQEGNSTWGVTPANGTTREVRLTSSSLGANKETVVSDELRADRMVSTVVEVAATSEGDINFEFSAGSQDIFLQAFLLGLWSRSMTFDFFKGANVSWTATDTITIAGVDRSDYFFVGQRVKTSGYTVSTNNNYWQVTAVAFGSGDTTVQMTVSTATIEVGSAVTKIVDANDVVVLRDTTVSTSAAGIAGSGVFTAAITAGELTAGMNIYMEGLSYEEGDITFSVAAATDTETVTIGDGAKTVIFEFETTGGVTAGNVSVAPGATFTDSAANLTTAINAQRILGLLDIAASSAAGVVSVRNLNKIGGSLAEAGTNIAVSTPFAGGLAGTTGIFNITTATNDLLVVTPAPPVQSAGDEVTIKASMVRNPSDTGSLPHEAIVPQSFTLETEYNDINQFMVSDGMRAGSISWEIASGAIVTGTMSFNGKETTRSATTTLGAGPYTPLDSTATEVMNATSNVGSITKDGVALSNAIQSISIQGESTLRNQSAVGNKFPAGIGTGRFNLTGTVTAYFENGVLYDAFLNHTTTSLSWTFTDIDENRYVMTIPSMKYSSDPVAPAGIDQDVLEPIEFVAFRDPTLATMFQVDRFSSISPVTTS